MLIATELSGPVCSKRPCMAGASIHQQMMDDRHWDLVIVTELSSPIVSKTHEFSKDLVFLPVSRRCMLERSDICPASMRWRAGGKP